MNSPASHGAPGAGQSTVPLSAVFWTRVHRYRSLLRKRWWVLLLTISLGLCVQAWRVATQPPNYRSEGQVMMSGKVSTGERANGTYTETGSGDFQKTFTKLISGGEVRKRALEQLEARQGGAASTAPVEMDVTADGTIYTVMATGPDAKFTQNFLEESMKAFLDVRRGVKNDQVTKVLGNLKEEILRLEEELRKDDEAILEFQKKNNFVSTREDGNDAGKTLLGLRTRLNQLKAQADQTELRDPNQTTSLRALDASLGGAVTGSAPAQPGQGNPGGGALGDNGDSDVRIAKQNLVKLQADYEDLGRDLKPAHPKMRALRADLDRTQRALNDLQKQNVLTNKEALVFIRSLIKRTEAEITDQETRTLKLDLTRAELDKLRTKRDRDEAHYNEMQKSISGLNLTTNVEQDTVGILQHATAPTSVHPGWVKNLALGFLLGLASGVGILVLLDRIDDRMGSFSDFTAFFPETVIGQIPRDAEAPASKGGVDYDTALLQPDDQRYQLVESYRNIRSSLLYMPLEGERPKTLLITSAIPNEGKSTIATNLALVMAFAGMKTLLIDGDLRRGAIHDSFGQKREPGLTDVLGRNLPWREAVRTTHVENLSFLPRGKTVPQPSEYLLNPSTDALLKEIYAHFDYIIMDSSPVLAADDTASLAPKMDAVLFVVRLGFTSAKMSRKALEILEKRQANLPGVILNFVDTSSPEFVYYQYPEYYHSPAAEDEEEAPKTNGARNGSGSQRPRNGASPVRLGR